MLLAAKAFRFPFTTTASMSHHPHTFPILLGNSKLSPVPKAYQERLQNLVRCSPKRSRMLLPRAPQPLEACSRTNEERHLQQSSILLHNHGIVKLPSLQRRLLRKFGCGSMSPRTETWMRQALLHRPHPCRQSLQTLQDLAQPPRSARR